MVLALRHQAVQALSVLLAQPVRQARMGVAVAVAVEEAGTAALRTRLALLAA